MHLQGNHSSIGASISFIKLLPTPTKIQEIQSIMKASSTFSLSPDENKKDVVNRKNGQGPNHLKFFLLVFSKDEAQAQSPSPRRPKPKKPKSKP